MVVVVGVDVAVVVVGVVEVVGVVVVIVVRVVTLQTNSSVKNAATAPFNLATLSALSAHVRGAIKRPSKLHLNPAEEPPSWYVMMLLSLSAMLLHRELK